MRNKWYYFFSRGLEYSLYALVFFIPISKALIEIFFTIAITLFTGKKIIEKDYKFLMNKAHLFLALFMFFSSLSLLNSGIYFGNSIKNLVSKWLEYSLIFVIVADTFREQKIKRNCFFILIGISFFIGIDVFFQRYLGWEFFRQRKIDKAYGVGFKAVTGPFIHHNELGSYLAMMLNLALAQFILIKNKIGKIVYSMLVIIFIMGLLMTFSRGAWLGAGVAFILMLSVLRRFRILIAFTLVILLIMFLIPDVRQRVLFSFQKGGDARRLEIWQGAGAMIKERPFLGRGVGNFITYLPRYTAGEFIQYAHNSFLQMWAETGIFSLLSFLIFLLLVFINAGGILLKSKNPLLLGLFCGISGFLLHNFFDSQLYTLQLSVFFWLLLGFLSACSQPEKTIKAI